MNTQKKFFLTCFSLLAVMCLITQYKAHQMVESIPRLMSTLIPAPTKSLKIILYWTSFFSSVDFELGLGKIFENCTYKNCYTTHNKSEHPIEDFDAILFHGAQYQESSFGKPKIRKPNQVYIFAMLESPINTPGFIKDYNNFYNWTMTYRLDSDVWWPYGYVHKLRSGYQPPSVEDIKKRPKKVAWFVSRCHVDSHRNVLTRELRKYVRVDVYGKCGNLSCPRSKEDECNKKIEREYKFYLSFENSLCEDYVTEKLYNTLQLDIVPIVYGGANYTTLAPPKSVINVMDFKSVEDLAIYLKFLDKHPEEYLKYFDWKKNYVVVPRGQDTLCSLCKKLNEPIQPKTYSDIAKWWNGEDMDKCERIHKTN